MQRLHSTVRPVLRPALMLLAMSLTLTACGAGNEAQVTEQAESFLADIKVGAWNAAYSRMHRDLQSACGSVAALKQRVTTAQVRPQRWEFTDISAQNHTGYLQLTITTQAGATRYSNLSLERDEGEFKVRDWRNDAQGVCGDF